MPTVTKPGSGRKGAPVPPSPVRLPALPANRLPRTDVRIDRNHEVRIGVLAALGLTALVVGIPVLLAVFVGYPLPTSAPSHAWLTTSITASLIIKVLACVVWLVWAHFTICIVAEWRAIRRGRLPGSVPLGGGSQFLARRLVAAALLLAGTAALVPHGGGSGPVTRTASGGSAGATHAVVSTAVAGETSSPAATAATSLTTVAPEKYYVVRPPEGRRYDSLWDIAQRTLGDPLRYKEIFALNKDRLQGDGRRLSDANLIRPGWQLVLPADAAGPGVQVVAPASVPAPAMPATPGPVSGTPSPDAVAHSATALVGGSGSAATTVPTIDSTPAGARRRAAARGPGPRGVDPARSVRRAIRRRGRVVGGRRSRPRLDVRRRAAPAGGGARPRSAGRCPSRPSRTCLPNGSCCRSRAPTPTTRRLRGRAATTAGPGRSPSKPGRPNGSTGRRRSRA